MVEYKDGRDPVGTQITNTKLNGKNFCYEKNLLGLILVLGGSLRWLHVANHLFLMPNLSRLLQKSGNVITLW